jgi:hypothetical protein
MALPGNGSRPALDKRREGDETFGSSAHARLHALDAMLGGVAHDLNNSLSVVLMNLDVMQQDAAVVSKHGRRIEGMLDAMTGASALVRHLLNFSHSRRPEPEVISVAETLPPLIELIQVAIGREVDIVAETGEVGPCCVRVDPASFEVAVVHVALQLAAVMRGGGILTFRLGKDEASDGEIVLALDAESRDPQSGEGRATPDLAIVEHFAREAQGRMSSGAQGGTLSRVAIHLPACAETTVV